jgi:hypothetical protein
MGMAVGGGMAGSKEWAVVVSRIDFKPFIIKYGEGKTDTLPGARIARADEGIWILKVDDDVVVGSSPKACVRAFLNLCRQTKEELAKYLTEKGEDKLAAKKYAEASQIATKLAALEGAEIHVFGL